MKFSGEYRLAGLKEVWDFKGKGDPLKFYSKEASDYWNTHEKI